METCKMQFCEFAQLLYQYIGDDKNKGDFVAVLVQNIMEEPKLSNDKELDADFKFYPLDKLGEDARGKYFRNGLSATVARKILPRLDRERFITFIYDTPDDTLKLIEAALKKKGIDVPDDKTPETCADIFISILQNCASKKRKHSQKTSVDQASQFVQTTPLTSDFQKDRTSSPAGTSISGITNDSQAKKVRSVWEPEPVSMPEEFYKCFNKYAIADFVELDPMNLILINYMLVEKRPDGEAMIKGAIQFVKDTENAMQRAEISYWNEKVCRAISAFTKSLREYIDFLLKNAVSPDFTIRPFLLDPDDADEFERKEIRHRRKLRSIYKQITDVESRWRGLEMYVNFPGQ